MRLNEADVSEAFTETYGVECHVYREDGKWRVEVPDGPHCGFYEAGRDSDDCIVFERFEGP